MRIASNMMSYNFLRSLNKSLEKENTLQQQLADGKAIHRPSDDPVNTVRDLHYTSNQVQNEQFQSNLSTAQSWMENTDNVMSDLSSIMIKTKELVVSADNTKTTDALNTIGAQIDGMINQVVQLGNTKIGARYLFGGQNDSTQPFTRTTIKDPNSDLTREVVLYSGDTDKMSMAIQSGAANPAEDSVNITGIDAFGPVDTVYGKKTMQVLNQLLDIKNELKKTNAVSQTNSRGGIGTVGGAYTGSGYQNFSVRIDEVDHGAVSPTTGQVTKASYSMDGGVTWTSATVDSTTSTNASIVSLTNGVSFNITNSIQNKPYYTDAAVPPTINVDATGVHADVYSFRVPQTAFNIAPSNGSSGVAEIAGTYNGSGSTKYTLKANSVDSSGNITDASYSIDNGASWTHLSNYGVYAGNISGPMPSVTGDGSNSFDITVNPGGVDATNGLITGVTVTMGGPPPTPVSGVNVSYELTKNTDSGYSNYTSVITLPTGEVVRIPASKDTKENDKFVITGSATPVVKRSGNITDFTLPNGVHLKVSNQTAGGTTAKTIGGDTYSFTLPQGTGPDVTWLSQVATQQVDDIHTRQLQAQTNIGTRMATYQMAANILQNQNTVIQSDVAGAEDLNVPQAITDFNTAQNVYRSALAIGAKMMQKSLIDFLS
ncbi:MAG: flagellar hook-associated protein FlgL [Sporomusaceae bacterium]|nr:flagellar hook-associated protein FlgL [Sporomusaceae bacterium]